MNSRSMIVNRLEAMKKALATAGRRTRSLLRTLLGAGLLALATALPATTSAETPDAGKKSRERRMNLYIEALSVVKDAEKLKKILRREIALTPAEDEKRLMRLAQTASFNSLFEEAAAAYEKLLSKKPDDMTAMRNLGIILYDKRSYTRALSLLAVFNEKTGGDYQSCFAEAEALHLFKREPKKQESLYLNAIDDAGFLDGIADADSIRARALFRLGRREEAERLFAALEKKRPDDVFVLLAHASMLYEYGELKKAEALMERLPADVYAPEAMKRYKLDPDQLENAITEIALLRASIQIDRRELFDAWDTLSRLEARYPARPDVALLRAAYYASYSNWRGQLESLKEAMPSNAFDSSLTRQEQELQMAHGSILKSEAAMRFSSHDSFETLFIEDAEMRLTNYLRLGANYTLDIARLNDIPNKDGTTGDFHGTRSKSEVFLQADLINGDTVRASYYDQEGIPGAGGAYTLLDYWGGTTLKGAWRAPYWDQSQAVAEKGSRTFMELVRVLKPCEGLTLTGKGSYNSYNLGYESDLTRSYALHLRTEYVLPKLDLQKRLLGEEAAFSLNHEFDYEQYFDYAKNQDGTDKFLPGSRHLESFYLGFNDKIGPDLSVAAHGGVAYDFKNYDLSPLYGAEISYLITPRLEVYSYVNHVVSANKYLYVGLGMRYNFTTTTVEEILKRIPASGTNGSSTGGPSQ